MLAGAKLLSDAEDTVAVWALRTDLSNGSPVGTADLTRRDVRFSSAADADRYVSADAAIPREATLQRAVGAGELLPRAALGSEGSGPITEVPLSVASEAVPRNVSTGSVVDVWVVPDAAGGNRAEESVLVFDDVVVVAAPPSGSTLAPTSTRQIIIGVEPAADDQVADALAAAARGTTVVTKQG